MCVQFHSSVFVSSIFQSRSIWFAISSYNFYRMTVILARFCPIVNCVGRRLLNNVWIKWIIQFCVLFDKSIGWCTKHFDLDLTHMDKKEGHKQFVTRLERINTILRDIEICAFKMKTISEALDWNINRTKKKKLGKKGISANRIFPT